MTDKRRDRDAIPFHHNEQSLFNHYLFNILDIQDMCFELFLNFLIFTLLGTIQQGCSS